MGILDDVAGIVAGAAGPLLFNDATHKRTSDRVSDGRGGFTETDTAVTVQALRVDYTDFQRGQLGIPASHRKILVLASGLTNPPAKGDTLNLEGRDWSVVEVRTDPANAVYECECK